MDARFALLATLLAIGTYNAWQRWESRPVRPLDGALAPDEPVQTDLESAASAAPVRIGRWMLTPRANYDITARILSREDYRFDRLADLVPEDLALGWGPMSDNHVLAEFDISR
jgi:hypothetical protein